MSAPGTGDDVSQATYVITVLSYGYADCIDPTDTSTCLVSATVATPLTNYSFSNGSPAVPLTTRTTFPPTGTAEIVPNPNAGGVGVPVSVWANANPSCSDGAALLGSGDWATCEYHEWYESDEIPTSMGCQNPTCSCAKSEAISYTVGVDDVVGIDLLVDEAFPCDLFEFFFWCSKDSLPTGEISCQDHPGLRRPGTGKPRNILGKRTGMPFGWNQRSRLA